MKIKLLTSIVLGETLKSYCIGEIIELDEEISESLIKCRYAVKEENVIEEEIPKTRKPKTSKVKS